MKHKYFITGLPRSRTAWLSVVMTYGESWCFHDDIAIPDNAKWQEGVDFLLTRMDRIAQHHIGYSSPLLLWSGMWQDVAKRCPDARWLVVNRDMEAAWRSWEKATGQPTPKYFFEKLMEEKEKLMSMPNVLRIDVDLLDRTPMIELIWDRLTRSELYCPLNWFDKLLQLNVQVKSEFLMP